MKSAVLAPAVDAIAPPPEDPAIVPSPSQNEPSIGARRGRIVGQALFFALLVWTIVSGSVPILRETLFAPQVPRDSQACRDELSTLRARLAEADLREPVEGELAAVAAFRRALGDEAGRAWDARALELIDGCPLLESQAAYALARLKAADEALLRLDTREGAPARKAHAVALRAITPSIAPPITPSITASAINPERIAAPIPSAAIAQPSSSPPP